MNEQRLWDLVRYQRAELHCAGLISNDEYMALATDHAAVARLETYDDLRAQLAESQARAAKTEPAGWLYKIIVDKHRTGKPLEGQIQIAGIWGTPNDVLLFSANPPIDPWIWWKAPVFFATPSDWLDQQRRAARVEILDQICASLRDYPNLGGDIAIMQEVDRLVGKYRAALQPFATYARTLVGANWLPDACPMLGPELPPGTRPTVGDLRKAAEVLEGS